MAVENRSSEPPDPEHSVADLLTYAELLTTPPLAELYTYVRQNGPTTIESIKTDLDLPHSTTYKYVGTLEELGVLTRHDDTPTTVTVDPITLTIETPHGEITTTPALIEAVARQRDSEDIRVFVERQGVAKLAAAVFYARRVTDGELTQRTAANKLDVHPVEGITVVTALQDIVERDDHTPPQSAVE